MGCVGNWCTLGMKNVCDLLTVVYLKCHNCPHIESLMCVPHSQSMLATWEVWNAIRVEKMSMNNCFLAEYLKSFPHRPHGV